MLAEHYGIHFQRSHHTLETILPGAAEYMYFGHDLRTPVIVQEGITYLEDDTPAEHFRAVYRGDRFKFELENRRVAGPEEGSRTAQLSLVLADRS
jgi:DNA-binding GntR family transcriptional regulator